MEPLRRANNGDYCLLAIPDTTPAPLHEHQRQLQHIYGGFITSPVHLTLQRFTTTAPNSLSALRQNLQDLLPGILPLQMHVKMIHPLYSEFRQSKIIKWEIEVTKKVRDFFARLEEILPASGCISQYPARPLFSAEKILISRINSYRDYSIIDEYSIRTEIWKSSA